MSDKRKEFFELNAEYQKCLNLFYDKFLEGQDVSQDNLCEDILNKLKQTGSFYNDMQKEFDNYQQEALKEKK